MSGTHFPDNTRTYVGNGVGNERAIVGNERAFCRERDSEPVPDKAGTLGVPLSGMSSTFLRAIHVRCSEYTAHQQDHVRDGDGWRCVRCSQ